MTKLLNSFAKLLKNMKETNKMEKLIALKKEIGNDVVVWSTGAVKIDKNTAISVPINYLVKMIKITIKHLLFIILQPNYIGILKISIFAIINDTSANGACGRN